MADPSNDEIEMTEVQAREALRQFHLVYGSALAAWSRLEGQLFYWFQLLTGLNEKTARGVFFSARNFNARTDMLEAALDATHPTAGPVRDFLKAALKKAGGYSGFRNATTHGEVHINVQRGSPTAGQMVIIQGRKVSEEAEATMITMQDLIAAQKKFEALASYLLAALPLPGQRHAASLEMCQLLVLGLPSQAQATEDDRSPPKPKPPPKA